MRCLSYSVFLGLILAACGGGDGAGNAIQSPGATPQQVSATQLAQARQSLVNGPAVAMSDLLSSTSASAQSIDASTRSKAAALVSAAGSSTLYWYNPATGDAVAWSMNGASQTGSADLLRVPGWQITHVADFNGDGQPDLIWQNYSTGQTVLWLMNGNTTLSSTLLLTAPGWKVIKTGDFNGDGKADLLWYNAQTGQTVMWLMNGATVLTNQLLLTDPNWQVTQVGDFDGDGMTDLLWYSPTFQQTAMWLMTGATKKQGATVLAVPGWQVTQVGDLNSDGKTDLIWYNASTGQTAAWLMNGLANSGSQLLLTDPYFQVAQVADLNGDGKADLIWYAPALGQTVAWLMNGTVRTDGATLLAVPGWQVTQVADLNADGNTDLIWTNASSGQTVVWMMNGLSKTSSTLILTDPNYRVNLASSAPRVLSAVQTTYESVGLAANGGFHDLFWNLPASGAPVNGTGEFIVDITSGGLVASPLTGGFQTANLSWTSLSSALSVPTLPINLSIPTSAPAFIPTNGPTVRAPDRVVQNGAVVVSSSSPTTLQQVSYPGNNVQFDILAVDGKTVAYSTTVTGITLASVGLQSVAAPSDPAIAAWLDSENLYTNGATLLKPGAAFTSGAAYAQITATRNGDTMFVGDCALTQTTTSTTLVACQTGKTLGGASQTTESSFTDGTGGVSKVWTLATEGVICEIAAQAPGTNCPPFGVRYWVASTPRTTSMNDPAQTVSYRVYYELGGNIYTGSLHRNGAQIRQNLGSDAAPNIQPYYIRVNSAFVQSIKSALTF